MRNGYITLALILAVAAASSAQSLAQTLGAEGIQVAKAPIKPEQFSLDDLDGTERSLDSYKGSVVFLNFWATWCGPCRSEMPSMQRLHDELSDEGLQIVAVNLQESNARVKQFLDELNLSFTVLLDHSGTVGLQYGARSIPTTYLIGRDGFIFARAIGAIEWDKPTLVAMFRSVLENGFEYPGDTAQ